MFEVIWSGGNLDRQHCLLCAFFCLLSCGKMSESTAANETSTDSQPVGDSSTRSCEADESAANESTGDFASCSDSEDRKEDKLWRPPSSGARHSSNGIPDRMYCTVGESTPGSSTSNSSITTRRSRRMAGGVDPLLSVARVVSCKCDMCCVL